ncbi:RNA methyltransferase [Porphyromonas crevioricanis]|uniref:23S rRNA (guanosine(2251)-2'-O)-methyltransferase RlmB n=1 Tax=Porphyromonas crevioricanis TaxID=393921 RepID=UPI00052C7C30|nr:23S rRNA (guanosine(2251)-2'-O)-methyltransferase RlmB [Porphyromonas crevioricanis]KGN88738.1 RNA methyltransferase [Porphyromonas crevioricanis]
MAKDKLVFGIHPVLEGLLAGNELDRIYIKRAMRNEEINRIKTLAHKRSIPVLSVPVEKLDRMTSKNHQGIVAILSTIEYMPLSEVISMKFEQGQLPLILVLDGITDVRNFGAIARTAECTGVDAIVIPARGSVSVSGDAIKASAGALHRITVCREPSISQALDLLQSSGIRIVTASEKATCSYTEEKLELPLAIVMGAEDVGPSEETIKRSDSMISIPQIGDIGSLNVSVAAGVILYEVLRQQSKF